MRIPVKQIPKRILVVEIMKPKNMINIQPNNAFLGYILAGHTFHCISTGLASSIDPIFYHTMVTEPFN
jgi:hypothetical protein